MLSEFASYELAATTANLPVETDELEAAHKERVSKKRQKSLVLATTRAGRESKRRNYGYSSTEDEETTESGDEKKQISVPAKKRRHQCGQVDMSVPDMPVSVPDVPVEGDCTVVLARMSPLNGADCEKGEGPEHFTVILVTVIIL